MVKEETVILQAPMLGDVVGLIDWCQTSFEFDLIWL